jgi:glyoxylase-like metal-dependent hydrolase (beta-lactamase superfamily II)
VYRLGTDWVGWYLCDVGGAVTVVECGFSGYFEQLPTGLAGLGYTLDAVAGVVQTHYHSDHVGSAERIRTEAGETVFAPTDDAPGVRGGKVPSPRGFTASLPRASSWLVTAGRSRGFLGRRLSAPAHAS